MKAQNTVFQNFLLKACKGTSVTPRELVGALSYDDIVSIKTGDLLVEDVLEIVKDLADSKDNAFLYKIPMKKSDSGTYHGE